MYKSDKAYFNAAKAISKLSDHQHKLGCVVVMNHRIISSGHNSKSKYHRLQAELDKSFFNDCTCLGPLHAEIDALKPLINARINLNTSIVYIYRQHKDGSPALARPCQRCMKIIQDLHIKKIKYTTEDGYASEVLLKGEYV